MKFLRTLLCLMFVVPAHTTLLHAEEEDASWLDASQEFTLDDPLAENFTPADIVADQPTSDADFDAMMKSWDEPAPAAVTEPEPVATSENIPMPIELPVIGTLNLFPYTDPVTQKKGFRVKFPSSGRLINFGPLVLEDGAFSFADNKLNYGATATLFGKGVRVETKEISQAEETTKDVEIKGKGKKKVEGKKYTKVRLGVNFLPGQQITFEIIPGARFTVVAADLILAKNKPLEFVIRTTIADKYLDFRFVLGKEATDAVVEVPKMPLKVLIPDVKGTPVEDVLIDDMSLTIKNFMTKKKDKDGKPIKPKKRVIKLHGKLDFSEVEGLEESKEAKAMELTGTYDAKKGTYKLEGKAKDISLGANVGVLHNAKIIIDFTRKKKKDPLQKNVTLKGDLEFDAGFGKFTVEVDGKFSKEKGIEFSGKLKGDVSFEGVTLSNPLVAYSTKAKKLSIGGAANILGYEVEVKIFKGAKGNAGIEASLGDKDLRPFSKIDAPGFPFKDLAIRNVKLSFQQAGKEKALAAQGTVTLFDQETTAIVYMTGANFTALIDIPGTMSITKITDRFGAIGDMFRAVASLIEIKLNKAKVIISNQTAQGLEGIVGTVQPGVGIVGNVQVGGAVGDVFKMIGLGKGVNADIFLPLNPSNVDGVRIGISQEIDAKLAPGFVTINSLGYSFKGGKPPAMGLNFNADIAGAKIKLESSFKPSGDIDFEGSVQNGDIDMQKIGFPARIQNPLVMFHTKAGQPTGFGLGGKFKFGNATGDIYLDLDIKEPHNSLVQFKDLNVCLTDAVGMWIELVQKAAKTGTNFNIPGFMCLENVSGQWSMKLPYATKKNCEVDCIINPGIALSGAINLGLPHIPKGKLEMEISFSQITAQGSLDSKVDLGGVIKISGANDTTKPPSLGIKITQEEQKAWIDGLVMLSIPKVLDIKQQTKLYISPSGGKLEGKITVDLPHLPTASLNILLRVDKDDPEVTGIGTLSKPIDLGGVIKITGDSQNSPPSIGLSISKTSQRVWIDGKIWFAGVAGKQTTVELSGSGLNFKFEEDLLGIKTKVNGKLSYSAPQDAEMEYELNVESLNNFVKEDLGGHLKTAQNEVSGFVSKATDEINSVESECNKAGQVFEDICKAPFEVAKGTLYLLKETVNQTLTGIQKLSDEIVSNFRFNNVSIKGSLKGFAGAGDLVTVSFSFHLFGKDIGATIKIPGPKDFGELAKKLAENIYNDHLKSPINELVSGAKKIYDETVGFVNSAVSGLLGVVDDIVGAAKKVGEVTVKFGNDVKNTAVDVGNTFKNIGEQTGGAIKDFSVKAANDIARTAVDVGNKVADAAKDMGNKIADFGKDAGTFTVDAANKVKDAFETAGREIKGGFETAGREIKGFFEKDVGGAFKEVGRGFETAGSAIKGGFEDFGRMVASSKANPSNW